MKLTFPILFIISLSSIAQSISPSVINSIGTSFQTQYAGIVINIGEPITGLIANNNNQITQGFIQPNNFTLNLKVYIEGFYTGNGLMNNNGAGGCLYVVGASTNSNDVDTIRLTLIDRFSFEPVETAFAILQINGMANFNFHSATENYYYLKFNHRNTIETWSAAPVLLTVEGYYNFTDSINKAYGSNMTETFDQIGWAIYSGDISDSIRHIVGIQDGIVEGQDYSDIENAVDIIYLGYRVEDLTGDGVVESTDYSLMENNVYYTIVAMHP